MEQQLARFVSEGVDTAKKGHALPIYRQVAPYLETGQLPLRSHYGFGWIIYYALHQQPDFEIAERKKMLANYLKLNVTKPHKLHSMILTEAMRLYKNAKDTAFNAKGGDVPKFSIVRFAELWDLDNLRPGDWRRKEFEDKELSSTVEKFITIYVDEVENGEILPSEAFMQVMERATAEYSDSYNLMSQRAVLHSMAGEREAARALLQKALLHAPGKFFLWHRLAMLYSPVEDPRCHAALLCKALHAPGQDQFKGRIRLSLAKMFAQKGMPGQALWELEKVRGIYESNGWHLPKAYDETAAKIPQDATAVNPEDLYHRLESVAEGVVYDALPVIRVTKTYHKNPDPCSKPQGRGSYGKPVVAWRVTDVEGNNYWLQPHRFKLAPDLPLGTALNIRVHNSRPVKAECVPTQPASPESFP